MKKAEIGRSYSVSAQVAPGIKQPYSDKISGSFSFGAFDAAVSYCKGSLPGYEVIPGGVAYSDCRRFDAIDHAAQLGASIWVREGI